MVRAGIKLSLLFGLYLLLSGQSSTDELVAAALCAIVAAALALTIPFIAERHFTFIGVPWLRLVRGVIGSLVTDLLRVGARLARPAIPPGIIQRWPFETGGEVPGDVARRALVTLATSVAPNTYVVAVLTGRGELLVHRLVPTSPSHNRIWPQ